MALNFNTTTTTEKSFLSQNKKRSFQYNIALANFLVSNTCEIKFCDVIGQSTNDVKAKILNHSQMICFGTLFFNSIRWIQLHDEKNLTFVDCCKRILLNSS